MKFIRTTWFPPGKFTAINLFGLVFWKNQSIEEYALPDLIRNHECIHFEQMKELLFIPFYILYTVEWLIRIIQYGYKDAYRNISFEREAYSGESNMLYIIQRSKFDFLIHMTKRNSVNATREPRLSLKSRNSKRTFGFFK